MNKDVKILSPSQSKYAFGEQSLFALLLVVTVIQITCAFSAGADVVGGNKPQVASVQLHDGTMLAKR
jgi:hypothetical protein